MDRGRLSDLGSLNNVACTLHPLYSACISWDKSPLRSFLSHQARAQWITWSAMIANAYASTPTWRITTVATRKWRSCNGSIENTEHVRRWKCPEAFLGADQGIKVIFRTAKIKKSRTRGCNMTFDPWKLSDRERQGTIKRSNTLFADQKAWSRSQTLQQATYKWLPLGVADWISGNDRRLA